MAIDLGIDQRVVDQRIGLAERRHDVEGQAARVAGTGAGEPDMAGLEARAACGDPRERSLPELMRAPPFPDDAADLRCL